MTSSLPFTNYRLDWERFCTAQPAEVAAELERLLVATQGCDDIADLRLAEVVGRAATDSVMARLVLQRVMPGLISVAKRRARLAPGTFSEILHDLVANGWIAACTYPLERRPRKIASNLVRDIEYLTFVQSYRLRRVATEHLTDAHEVAASPETSACEDVIATLHAARRAGADPAAIRLLGELVVSGRSVSEVAESYGVTPRTILTRRRAAEATLLAYAA